MLYTRRKLTVKQQFANLVLITCCLVFLNTASANTFFTAEKHGAGKPVILIPGLMSDASVWQTTIDALKTDYELHALSIAGFGDTPAVNNISVKNIAADIADYIKRNQLDKPIVIGHSLGGFLSYYMGIHYPNQVGKIASVDGLPFIAPIFTRNPLTSANDMKGSAARIRTQYEQMSAQQMVYVSKASINIQATKEADQSKVLGMIAKSDPKTVSILMYELMTTDLRDAIQKSEKPILLLGASGGFNTTQEHQFVETLYRQQFEGMDNANIVMNTQSRHFIMYDDPTWLTNQLTTFIGN